MLADPAFDWLTDLPLAPGAPDLRMGTRSLDEADWLTVDSYAAAERELRASLLAEHPDHAQLLDGHGDALGELIELVETHRGESLATGPDVDGVPTQLSDLAVSIVEDVLLLAHNEDHGYLAGGVLLFPDQWDLTQKLGLSIADVHGPVAGYGELLEARVDQFFDRLTVGQLVRRRNWFIHDCAEHFLPGHITPKALTEPDDVDSLWLRSERQTLRRLDRSGAIVFTIKTQFAPMGELRARPQVASDMVEFLTLASPRSLANKDVEGRADAVVGYLRS